MATVLAAITVNTTTATASSPPDRCAAPIVLPAARHITRFLGLTADSRNPRPSALPKVSESIVLIHLGSSAATPGLGRSRHCRTASPSSNTPKTSFSTDDTVDGFPVEVLPAWPTSRNTTTVTTTIPATHPARNPVLVLAACRDSSIKMTALIGIGLSATPSPSGSRSPITAPTPPPSPLRLDGHGGAWAGWLHGARAVLSSGWRGAVRGARRPRPAAVRGSCRPAGERPVPAPGRRVPDRRWVRARAGAL